MFKEGLPVEKRQTTIRLNQVVWDSYDRFRRTFLKESLRRQTDDFQIARQFTSASTWKQSTKTSTHALASSGNANNELN